MTKNDFLNRFKSLLWRAGMVALAAGLSWVLNNLSMLSLSPTLTVVIGLVLGEVSKQINNNLTQK
jgi:hypothetical protein